MIDNKKDIDSKVQSKSRANASFSPQNESAKTTSNLIEIPSINLPKGGGALKNIDEKFQVNTSNGTASFSIPLPFSKTRSDFAPSLSLSYNSGSGSGYFGLGWSLGLPAIQRKTDKKLPLYQDDNESDIFMFTGVEDLVPVLIQDTKGNWVAQEYPGTNGESVKRYRPRIEGAFNRIERVTLKNSNSFYWKVTSKENTVTIFGRSKLAQIADPLDDTRIFKWLPELSYDDRGNCFEYVYVSEDFRDVPSMLSEQNRLNGLSSCTNTYLKRVRYGNTNPYIVSNIAQAYNPLAPGDAAGYMFETVFDFGDENIATGEVKQNWPCRYEPFSDYKAGFEIRTYRLCRRVLFFHYFKELNDGKTTSPCLVRSLDLFYKLFQSSSVTTTQLRNAETDYIISIQQSGYIKKPDGTYSTKSLPPVDFYYQELNWNTTVQNVTAENFENDPVGLTASYQWTDLWSEGISGILTEQANGWFYKYNLGDGKFTPTVPIIPKPSFIGLLNGSLQLQDLEADGRKFIVSLDPYAKGYFEINDENEWQPFQSFDQMPNIALNDPNTKYIDLNGDGKPDLIISEENVFTWYANLGIVGYDSPEMVPKPYDEEKGPAMVFADSTQSIFLTDMSGDGMTDIVRIRNGEVCYWPNLGYGKFGAKVNMSNAPVFDFYDLFNPAYLQLADINGTGATDILYIGKNQFSAWLNLSGNGWSEVETIDPFPTTEQPNQISVLDFLGNGTGCIVWSSPLPHYADTPMRYIDLMGGKKPYIMSGYENNLGNEVNWLYKSSTQFYLEDKTNLTPWITKLPFPVQCVSSVTINDAAADTLLTNTYSYRHGYYDHPEREFRGFGRVDQTDAEEFGVENNIEPKLNQSPVKTITWYHTGAYFNEQEILNQFESEYNKGSFEFDLPAPVLPYGLTPDESREALRACKGMILRQEVYAVDQSTDQGNPYSVSTHNCLIKLLQPQLQNRYAVFLMHETEALDIHYERNLNDPRIAHTLNLEVDNVGNVLKSAAVVYGRKTTDATLPVEIQQEQNAVHVIITQNDFTINPASPDSDFYFDEPLVYRSRLLSEAKTYELTNNSYNAISQFNLSGLVNDYTNAIIINYESTADGSLQKRLIEDIQTIYLNDDLTNPRPLGQMGKQAFLYQTYHLAFTPSLVSGLFGTRVTPAILVDAKYIQPDGINWWIQSGRNNYVNIGETAADAQKRFYLPVSVKDPYDIETQLFYDDYNLLLMETEDVLHNTVSAEIDYRVLQPVKMTDINNNSSEILTDELGMVIATSVYGDESDGVHGDKPLSNYTITAPTNLDEVISNPQKFLQQATTFFYYDLFAWLNDNQPVCFASVVRETHVSELSGGDQTKVFLNVGYTSGLGKNLQAKIQAEPGEALQWNNGALQTIPNADPRWIGTGRTILNNKGNPVKQYEPFFSTTYNFESEDALVQIGFASTTSYDPLSRPIRVDHPNGTFSSTEFDAWMQKTFDENDNVKSSNWFLTISNPDPAQPYYEQWYDLIKNDPEKVAAVKDAAQKAAAHDNTPTIAYLDSLGRTIYTIADNGTAGKYATHVVLDIENNQRQVIDARGNTVMEYDYDMVSRQAHQTSMDAGERWIFNDVMNKLLYKWDSRDQRMRVEYDDLHRPTNQWLTQNVSQLTQADLNNPVTKDTPQNNNEKLIGVTVYGEDQTVNGNSDTQLNLRGKPFQSYDQSGLDQMSEYDFKGNLKTNYKQLASDYKNIVDWNTANKTSLLDISGKNTFTAASKFDATNKAVEMDMPDGSKIYPFYNLTNLLKQIDVLIASKKITVSFVQNIDYNAKGQRESILYGNNTTTGYAYEETTYRLSRLLTTRNNGADIIQDLNYTYDPVGNITQIIDHAQQTNFFNNAAVDPSSNYTYDAIYRLTDAQGREHIGQNAACDQFDTDKTQDGTGQRLVLPGDINAMQRYDQQYEYDAVGNMLQMIHNAGNGAFTNKWTRAFSYNANNNQLKSTQVGADVTSYNFDAHGNMLNLQSGSYNLTWNYADQLQQVDLGGGGIAYYVYDAGGQRVRKVIENNGLVKERIYLGSYEVYRETQNGNLQLERETPHIMDDKSRIAMIETVTQGSDSGLPFLIRYQYANHLGSSCIELAGTLNSSDKTFVAQVISYEEYYPYGSTAYQAMDNQTETAKRYRYTGMERDEESGLNYHSARYYVPWLGRWASCDPEGISVDADKSRPASNSYSYVRQNPVHFFDPGGQREIGFDELTIKPIKLKETPQKISVPVELFKGIEAAFKFTSTQPQPGFNSNVKREVEATGIYYETVNNEKKVQGGTIGIHFAQQDHVRPNRGDVDAFGKLLAVYHTHPETKQHPVAETFSEDDFGDFAINRERVSLLRSRNTTFALVKTSDFDKLTSKALAEVKKPDGTTILQIQKDFEEIKEKYEKDLQKKILPSIKKDPLSSLIELAIKTAMYSDNVGLTSSEDAIRAIKNVTTPEEIAKAISRLPSDERSNYVASQLSKKYGLVLYRGTGAELKKVN
jgi:RHS repeat-associated protein